MKHALASCILAMSVAALSGTLSASERSLDKAVPEDIGIFAKAFATSGLTLSLPQDQPFTLFVPSDAALDLEGAAVLLRGVYTAPSNRQRLVDLMGYHFVPGRKLDLTTGSSFLVGTRSGDTLEIERRDGETILNGHIRVTQSIALGGGVVHIISGLLWSGLVYNGSGPQYQAFADTES